MWIFSGILHVWLALIRNLSPLRIKWHFLEEKLTAVVSCPMFTHYSGEMVQLNMICLKPGTMESESCFHYSVCSRCMTVEADFSSHYIFLEHLQSIFTQQLNYQHQWWILLSILPRTLLWNSKWSRQSGKVHEGCCFERLCEWTRGRGLHGFLC